MNAYNIAIILAASASLAGCDGLTILEGKPSPFKAEVERRALITLPPDAEVVEAVADVPVVQVPECTGDTFRVSRCLGGKIMPWEY